MDNKEDVYIFEEVRDINENLITLFPIFIQCIIYIYLKLITRSKTINILTHSLIRSKLLT